MSKSYVGMAFHLCGICGVKTEQILMDTKMRDTFESNKEAFLGYNTCDTCQGHLNDGLKAVVEVFDEDTSRPTGRAVWIPTEAHAHFFPDHPEAPGASINQTNFNQLLEAMPQEAFQEHPDISLEEFKNTGQSDSDEPKPTLH